MFWLDPNPNPKKKFGFGSRHCCRMEIYEKNRRSNTWKRKILCFSIETFFSPTYRFQNTYSTVWKQLEAAFRKIWGQNISRKNPYPNPKKNLWIRIRKKWVRIHNTAITIGVCIIETHLSSLLQYIGCGASIRPKGPMPWMSAVL
jgi:hypothetical protein